MSFGIDGLASGLDTTSLINSLMQAEGVQQTALKNRATATDGRVTAFQGLNTKVKALETAAAAFANGTAFKAVTATASSTGLGVTSTAAATPGTYSVTVKSLASTHSVFTPAVADPAAAGSVNDLTITGNDGSVTTLDVGNGSLAAAATAINAAGKGVTATVLKSAEGEHRLVVTSQATGADSQFSVSLNGATSTVAATGSDAVVDLGGGLEVRRTTNSLSDVIPGVTLDLKTADPSKPVTVTVASDPKALGDSVSALVDAANAILSEIKTKSTPGAAGKAGGPFVGDATTRALTQSVLRAVSDAVGGQSAASLGIQTTREGTIAFKKDEFLAAYEADPAKVRDILAPSAVGAVGIAERFVDLAVSATRSGDGSLTSRIEGLQSTSRQLTSQVEAWDRRLELRRSTLQRQFSGLEVALSKLNDQSGWLAGQLSSLSAS